FIFFFSSRRRHTRSKRDWSSDVCSSDLIEPMIVGSEDVQLPLEISYPQPKEIGADRIVNAIGALELYESPFVIIDFGTATTFCYVNEKQQYIGGIIAPGIKISMDALYAHASKLPKIEIEKPDNIIGQSTVEAM